VIAPPAYSPFPPAGSTTKARGGLQLRPPSADLLANRPLRCLSASNTWAESFTTPSEPTDSEAAVQFLAGACLGLLIWWLDNDVPYSAEELHAIFRRLTTQGVRRFLTASYYRCKYRRCVTAAMVTRRTSTRGERAVSEHVRWERARRDSEAVRAGYQAARRAFEIVQAVRSRRLELGISQSELARRAG
jgi:hypothetical protein